MRLRNPARRAPAAALALLLTGCATNPVTGGREFTFMTEGQEVSIGRDADGQIREQMGVYDSPALQAYVADLGHRLAALSHRPNLPWQFTIVDSPAVNAFALPGGYIFVAPALVDLAGGGRDELAFIVAHEMAHVIRRHAIDRILSQRALKAITLASPAARSIAPWVRTVGVQWLERAYSQDQEYEADELGGRLMRAAAFDPAGAVRMLERLGALEPRGGTSGLGNWLSTHPPTADRILRLREQLDLR